MVKVVVVVPRRRAPFKLSSSRKSLVLCCSSSFVGAVKFSSKVSVFFPTKKETKNGKQCNPKSVHHKKRGCSI